RNSQALEDYWQRSVTAEQLQAEMERMAKHTKQPEVLHELFEALGNDPYVIAECLARPTLVERLVGESKGRSNLQAISGRDGKRNREAVDPPDAAYILPEIFTGCTDGTWVATSIVNAP